MTYSFRIGDTVQSHFRASWKGNVIEGPDKNNCYIVRVTIDQHNNPMRKPVLKQLNGNWLSLIKQVARA